MLSLKPVIFANQVLYVGETSHTTRGLVHVFAKSVSISCKHDGENILAIPVPSNRPVAIEQIIQVGGITFPKVLLSTIIGENVQMPILPQLECEVELLSGANQIEQEFSSLEGISGFGSLIGEFYPGCQMLTCSFEGFDGTRELSVLLWYEPARVEAFFLPTVVGTADSIDFKDEVHTDYWALMSTLKMSHGIKPQYDKCVDKNQLPFLPKTIVGKRFDGWHRNADTMASVEGIQAGFSDAIHRRSFWGLWHG